MRSQSFHNVKPNPTQPSFSTKSSSRLRTLILYPCNDHFWSLPQVTVLSLVESISYGEHAKFVLLFFTIGFYSPECRNISQTHESKFVYI